MQAFKTVAEIIRLAINNLLIISVLLTQMDRIPVLFLFSHFFYKLPFELSLHFLGLPVRLIILYLEILCQFLVQLFPVLAVILITVQAVHCAVQLIKEYPEGFI